MFRSAFAILCFSTAAFSQSILDKAPPDVEDALRARITEFYQDHVDKKYRKAEELVAEDSKDAFYDSGKAEMTTFRIENLIWSDNFTRVKAVIVAKMPVPFPGFEGKMTDVPFPSYWKLEKGQWFWYAFTPETRQTPFGTVKTAKPDGKTAQQLPPDLARGPDLAALMTAVEPDKTAVRLSSAGGTEDKVKITNKLPGPVTLELPLKHFYGMEVTFDRTDLKEGETATMTFRSVPGPRHPSGFVRLNVKPTKQTIDIQVSFN